MTPLPRPANPVAAPIGVNARTAPSAPAATTAHDHRVPGTVGASTRSAGRAARRMDAGDGFGKIVNVNSGLCLEPYGTADGSVVRQWNCDDSGEQKGSRSRHPPAAAGRCTAWRRA